MPHLAKRVFCTTSENAMMPPYAGAPLNSALPSARFSPLQAQPKFGLPSRLNGSLAWRKTALAPSAFLRNLSHIPSSAFSGLLPGFCVAAQTCDVIFRKTAVVGRNQHAAEFLDGQGTGSHVGSQPLADHFHQCFPSHGWRQVRLTQGTHTVQIFDHRPRLWKNQYAR